MMLAMDGGRSARGTVERVDIPAGNDAGDGWSRSARPQPTSPSSRLRHYLPDALRCCRWVIPHSWPPSHANASSERDRRSWTSLVASGRRSGTVPPAFLAPRVARLSYHAPAFLVSCQMSSARGTRNRSSLVASGRRSGTAPHAFLAPRVARLSCHAPAFLVSCQMTSDDLAPVPDALVGEGLVSV